jgi:potassium-dependent mechanosensitive channel
MDRRLLSRFLAAAACVAWSALAVPDLAAANPLAGVTRPAAAVPALTPAIEAVPAADIPLRADADERFVSEVAVRARTRDPAGQLEPELARIRLGALELLEVFQREEVQRLPAIRLSSLERHWNFYDRQLTEWRRQLQRLTSRYSDDAAELARLRATWELTRDTAGLPSALADRAGALLQQIVTAERALARPLDALLDLGRRGNAVQSSVNGGKQSIASAIALHDQRLYTLDAPPLWEAWADPDYASDDALEAARTGLRIERNFLAEYAAANVPRLRAYAFFALMLLPLLVWLSRRSRSMVSGDDELRTSGQVLVRPLSSWLVLTLVSVPLVLPDAPLLIHQTALLLALIPVLRLLPQRLYDVLGPAPYVVTGLYLLQRLGFLLLGHPLYYRLHLLGMTALTLAAVAWLLVRHRNVAGTALVRALRVVGVIAVVALVASLGANLLGNTSLAEITTGGVIASAYIALAVHAGASVLAAVVRLLLARKLVARFRVVTQRAGPLVESLGRLIRFGALAVWLLATLAMFRLLRPMAAWLDSFLNARLEVGQISITAGGVLLFVLSVWVAFWLARAVRVVLHDEVLPKMDLPRGVGNSVSTLSYYALVIVGLMVALAAAGFEAGQFALVFGALGVGIGFGLQNVVNNFVSGLILMFERPIQPGDVVEVSGTSGRVREIGMRATTLTTFEGADVVVPNGTLLSEKLINWTLSDMNRRMDVNVGVAYGTDPKRVLALLDEVARTTPGVATDPAPTVLFVGFGASSLDFTIRAWTNQFSEWVAIRSLITVRVYDALQAAGIEIPFPQQDLHLRSISPAATQRLGEAVAPRQQDAAPAPEC